MTCVGFGGLVLLITNIQLAAMFGKGRTTFVSVLSGCLDVSAIVQLLIKNVVTAGVDFLYTYIGMTFIACLTFISTLLWLPREPIVIVKERPKTDVTTVDAICPADSSQPADVDGKITSYVTSPSLLKSMASPLFLLHVLWFCVLQLRFFFFLGVMNRWLTQLTDGDLEQVDHYTSVQLYIGMASFVFAVLAGTLYDVLRHRYADATSREGRLLGPGVAPLSVGSGLCCLLSVLVLSHDPRVLYVTFLVQAAFRSTLYSLAASFLAVTFPGELFGVLYGTMVICGGVVGCLQYALYLWAEASLDSILHMRTFTIPDYHADVHNS
nr:hypothetical protein BaRGS_011311 [Batillaria attramentaria]